MKAMSHSDTETNGDGSSSEVESHEFNDMVWDMDSGGYVYREKARHFKDQPSPKKKKHRPDATE